jgi:hypothetical protein
LSNFALTMMADIEVEFRVSLLLPNGPGCAPNPPGSFFDVTYEVFDGRNEALHRVG